MNKSGRYLLTGILAIMLVLAPLRAVMALSTSSDLCASMSDHGKDTRQAEQASTNPDTGHASQAHGQGCCNNKDSACTTDCQACISLSYVPVTGSPVKSPPQHFLYNGFKASAVPVRSLIPLLRPPATLHS